MKITVINGTEKHGVTYRLKEVFLDQLRNDSEITEFYLPKDCPNFCVGCITCFSDDEHKCKDAVYIQKIEKAMLDHFGYRWMPHRPAKEMFGKRAVIITQCLGAGGKSAAKDIKDSLSWWGISSIRVISFKLMSEVRWDKIPKKKRDKMTAKLVNAAERVKRTDFSKPAKTGLTTRFKFYAVRMLQTGLGKDNPEYTDYKYWKERGWIDNKRPWK